MKKKHIILIICIITAFNSIQSMEFDHDLAIEYYSENDQLPLIITPFHPTSKKDLLCKVYLGDSNRMYSRMNASGRVDETTKQNRMLVDFHDHESNLCELYLTNKDVFFGIHCCHTTQNDIMKSPLKLTRKQIQKIKELGTSNYNIVLWDGKYRYDILRTKQVELSLLDQINQSNNLITGIPQLLQKIYALHNERKELQRDNKGLFDENIRLQETILSQSQNTVNQLEPQELKSVTHTIPEGNMYKTKIFYFMAGGITFATLAVLALRFFRA